MERDDQLVEAPQGPKTPGQAPAPNATGQNPTALAEAIKTAVVDMTGKYPKVKLGRVVETDIRTLREIRIAAYRLEVAIHHPNVQDGNYIHNVFERMEVFDGWKDPEYEALFDIALHERDDPALLLGIIFDRASKIDVEKAFEQGFQRYGERLVNVILAGGVVGYDNKGFNNFNFLLKQPYGWNVLRKAAVVAPATVFEKLADHLDKPEVPEILVLCFEKAPDKICKFFSNMPRAYKKAYDAMKATGKLSAELLNKLCDAFIGN